MLNMFVYYSILELYTLILGLYLGKQFFIIFFNYWYF